MQPTDECRATRTEETDTRKCIFISYFITICPCFRLNITVCVSV